MDVGGRMISASIDPFWDEEVSVMSVVIEVTDD